MPGCAAVPVVRMARLTRLHRLARCQRLLLRLHIVQILVDLVQPRAQFVERVVHRLHLAGELLQRVSLRPLLVLRRFLHRIHFAGHLGHAVRGLLQQVVHGGIVLSVRLLHAHHHLLHLLHLRLQGDDVFVGGEGAGCADQAREHKSKRWRFAKQFACGTWSKRNERAGILF